MEHTKYIANKSKKKQARKNYILQNVKQTTAMGCKYFYYATIILRIIAAIAFPCGVAVVILGMSDFLMLACFIIAAVAFELSIFSRIVYDKYLGKEYDEEGTNSLVVEDDGFIYSYTHPYDAVDRVTVFSVFVKYANITHYVYKESFEKLSIYGDFYSEAFNNGKKLNQRVTTTKIVLCNVFDVDIVELLEKNGIPRYDDTHSM